MLWQVDDAWNLLCASAAHGKECHVHFLNDNAGLELASDLFLCHYLLSTGQVPYPMQSPVPLYMHGLCWCARRTRGTPVAVSAPATLPVSSEWDE